MQELAVLFLAVIGAFLFIDPKLFRSRKPEKPERKILTPFEIHQLEIECEIIPADTPPPVPPTQAQCSCIRVGQDLQYSCKEHRAPSGVTYSARLDVPEDMSWAHAKYTQLALRDGRTAYGYECSKCNGWWTAATPRQAYEQGCRGTCRAVADDVMELRNANGKIIRLHRNRPKRINPGYG